MTNREKYNRLLNICFTVEDTVLNEDFSILNIEKWDSVAHMGLISELEEAFDIMFDTDGYHQLYFLYLVESIC